MENQDDRIKTMVLRRNIALSTIFGLIFVATLVFRHVEHWTWLNSFYFVVATSATVGYGDITPQTELGRLLVSLFIIIQVPIILYSFTVIAELFFERKMSKKNNSK